MNDQAYNYKLLDIAESAVTDQEYEISGHRIFYHSGSGSPSIKLNSMTNDAIPLSLSQEIIMPFKKFYLTCTSAIDLTIFISSPENIRMDSRLSTVSTIDDITRVQKTSTGSYGHKTIATTPTLIHSSNTSLKRITIQNWGSAAIFLGTDTSVTTSNAGIRLAQYDAKDFDFYTGDIYGIVASGTNDISYITEGI